MSIVSLSNSTPLLFITILASSIAFSNFQYRCRQLNFAQISQDYTGLREDLAKPV